VANDSDLSIKIHIALPQPASGSLSSLSASLLCGCISFQYLTPCTGKWLRSVSSNFYFPSTVWIRVVIMISFASAEQWNIKHDPDTGFERDIELFTDRSQSFASADVILGLLLVFAGPVHWTENMTKTKLNPTAKDQTASCTDSEKFQLPVARFVKKWKDRKRPVWTSCNQSFTYVQKVHWELHKFYTINSLAYGVIVYITRLWLWVAT